MIMQDNYIQELSEIRMNEIIIKRGSYNNHYNRKSNDEFGLNSSRHQGLYGIDKKIDINEIPNLEMKMLKRERFSEKKHNLKVNQTSLYNYQQERRQKSQGLVGKMHKNNINFYKNINDSGDDSNHKELFFKNGYTHIKNRRFYFPQQTKTSNSINKINATAQIATTKHRQQSQFSRISQQKILNLSKSQSCKTRPISNLLNPEQLFEIHKNNQIHEANKRLILRMSKEKDRQLYEQAISHLYEMVKNNFFHDKVRSEMPCELDVNKINIPRRNHKQEWAEKMKKYHQNVMKYRQEYSQLRLTQGKQKQSLKKMKIRTKTDTKIVQQGTRNQTEFIEKNELWMELIDKNIAPWEFESINSKFYQ